MQKCVALAVIVGLAAGIGSCTPNRVTDSTSYDTVTTTYDKQFNFAAARTYAMPDSVIHFVPEGETDEIPHSADETILSEVRRQMGLAGYTEVPIQSSPKPSVVLLTAATTRDYLVTYWYDYCGYWGWYYPPGYGCGGWYYPGNVQVYSYTTGTLLIFMLDGQTLGEGQARAQGVWTAGINAVLGSTRTTNLVQQYIAQAFNQSPYLKTN
jgi:hypothetical protein